MDVDYPNTLTDNQWQLIKNIFPHRKLRGRPPVDRRAVVNAIFYLCRTGCPWRYLPKEFPHWNTVYGIYRSWIRDGTLLFIHEKLREKVRKAAGKTPTPSVGIIDSQSVRTAEGGEERGFDWGKKITGRKRHIVVDTLGMILTTAVHGAQVQDYDGAMLPLFGIRHIFKRLKTIFADGAYGKSGLPDRAKEQEGVELKIIKRSDKATGFQLLPKRWIVERTFAWLSRRRRLSKDYEKLTETSQAMIQIAMIELMIRRLAKSCCQF